MKKIYYWVSHLKGACTFDNLKEAKEFGRKNNLPVFIPVFHQHTLPVGANQRCKNEIYELEQKIKALKDEMKNRKHKDVNFPYDVNDKQEFWSARKYRSGK